MNGLKKIFITGGTGFIGRHLIEKFNTDNYLLYILTRNSQQSLNNRIIYITGSIEKIEEHSELISGCDYFIHLAGEKKDESKIEKVNVGGMNTILAVLAKCPNIKFVYISSAGVYGINRHPEKVITENSVCLPYTTYERSKLQAEKILVQSRTVKYIILRPSNIFGEYDPSKKLLNLFKSLKLNQFFYINKSANVNYVYVKHLAEIILMLVERDLFTNEIYTVNSHAGITMFVDTIKDELNLDVNIKSLPAFLLKPFAIMGDLLPKKFQLFNSIKFNELMRESILNSDKIHKLTGLNENEFLRIGLKNTINFYKQEGFL